MLRTNSKQTKKKIDSFILNQFNFEGKTSEEIGLNLEQTKNLIAMRFIIEILGRTKERINKSIRYYGNIYDAFVYWCQGLPNVLETSSYYLGSAVEKLGDILEETKEEKARFTECQAEELMTLLIYRNLEKNINKMLEGVYKYA